MTILTNKIRAAVLKSCIDATFIKAKQDAILESTAKVVRTATLAKLPPEFQAATANLPLDWFNTCSSAALARDGHPGVTLGREHRNWSAVSCNFDGFRVPASFVSHAFDEEWCRKNLATQLRQAAALVAEEEELRSELRGLLASCKTFKQLIEKMPSLERHLPGPAVSYPVVVSTAKLEKALKGLGFARSVP